jgi:hypothetical protein
MGKRLAHGRAPIGSVNSPEVAFVINETLHEIECRCLEGRSHKLVLPAP